MKVAICDGCSVTVVPAIEIAGVCGSSSAEGVQVIRLQFLSSLLAESVIGTGLTKSTFCVKSVLRSTVTG